MKLSLKDAIPFSANLVYWKDIELADLVALVTAKHKRCKIEEVPFDGGTEILVDGHYCACYYEESKTGYLHNGMYWEKLPRKQRLNP